MQKLFLLFIVISLMTGGAHASDPADAKISVADVRADLALLKEAYTRIHPGLTRYADDADIDAAWAAIDTKAAAKGGLTLGEFYIEIQRALTVIRCDHTKAEIPRAMRDFRKETPVYLPFKWTLVEGRGFITAVPAGSPLAVKDEILAIDGRALSSLVEEVAPLVPVDGYTVWARDSGVGQSLEFMGGAVDHFGMLLWDNSPVAVLTIRRGGEELVLTAPRLTYDAYAALEEADEPAANFKDAVTFKRIGDNAAYLRVDTFVNYRQPVEPKTIYDPIFKALKDEGRDKLILDVRRNGGGSDDAKDGLVENLITKKMRIVNDARVATIDHSGLEEHLSTWEKRAINPPRIAFKKNTDGTYSLRPVFDDAQKKKKPTRNAFAGDLIVLTSRDNSSGSTNLVGLLKSLGRATLVGEQTGGSPNGATAGVILTLTLPNSKIRARIPQFRYYNNVSGFEDGYGASPDIDAPLTADAFLAGRDPAYEAALEIVAGR